MSDDIKTYDVYCGKRAVLPSITRFLAEYDELCERHGLRFNVELSSGWDVGDADVNVSLILLSEMPPEDEDKFLNPALSDVIPEVNEAIERAKRELEEEWQNRERDSAERAAALAAIDPIPGLQMAHQHISAGNTSGWVTVAKASIAEAIRRLGNPS